MDDVAPIIDVFIMCCGEPTSVVINTTLSAAGQDCPGSRLRVLVCDDGHSEELRTAIEKLGHSISSDVQIMYGARSNKGKDFKAGNLRFGINRTAELGGGEFFACLDADMMTDPQWLRRMVPHLLLDPKMAMVNQPQHYYNTARNDPLSDQGEFDLWFTIFEPLNDRVGQAMCQGSGWLVRRFAIVDIGGWPLVSTGEDVMCAQKLLHHGWSLSYVREWLQHGRVADTLASRLEQKTRWAIDHIAFVETFGWRSITVVLGALTWREFTSITTSMGLVLLPLTLFLTTLSSESVSVSTEQYSWLVKLLLFTYFAGKLNDCSMYRHVGLSRLSKYQSLETWSAPYAASGLIENLLPRAAALNFSVTGTFKSQINERSKQTRASIVKRLLSPGARVFILYVLCSAALVQQCIQPPRSQGHLQTSAYLHVMTLPGPMLKMTCCIWKMFIPIWYMIFPPDVPERTELLEDNGKGALRPKRAIDPNMKPAGSKEDSSFARVWFDALELGVLLYHTGMLW